jgi:hypothetical protein
LISDSLLTSTPDPTGEKQKHTGKRIAFNTWHNAMSIQNVDMTRLMALNSNPKTC